MKVYIILSALLFLTSCGRKICCALPPPDLCSNNVIEVQNALDKMKLKMMNSDFDDSKLDDSEYSKELNRGLICASQIGNLDAVKLLISEGADVSAVDENGKTALQLVEEKFNSEKAALDNEQTEIVNLLKKEEVTE
ncbi:MAG: hypothetical protein OXJ52_07690 [Oligoflexia bacterium]|nr:hypothetical protein [Oligoflexia bacterium]